MYSAITAYYTHFQASNLMRFKVSTADHSSRKMQEEVMFGTLMRVRTKDRAEKPVPGPALALLRLLLVEEMEFVSSMDYTSYYLLLEQTVRKTNWLAQKTQKSLKKEFTTVRTNSPGKGRIPLLKRVFFPGIELHTWDLPTCPKEAKYLEVLNLIPPYSAPNPK